MQTNETIHKNLKTSLNAFQNIRYWDLATPNEAIKQNMSRLSNLLSGLTDYYETQSQIDKMTQDKEVIKAVREIKSRWQGEPHDVLRDKLIELSNQGKINYSDLFKSEISEALFRRII